MIWVFTVIEDNVPIHQFICKGELPDYATFRIKLDDDKLLHPLFETLFYKPMMAVLQQDITGHPHAGFKHNGKFFLCCGFPNA